MTQAVGSARPKAPIDYFRQLLAMTPSEQARALAKEPVPKRTVLEAKIKEYSSLPPADREMRLQLVELYYYLRPLMELAPAERPEKLAIIPAKDRGLIEERLRQWDSLKPEVQKDVLENELTIHYFLRLESGAAPQQQLFPSTTPNDSRQLIEEKIEQWRALPPESRQKLYRHFNQFFSLPAREKEKTLDTLPDGEREQMEKSLKTFEKLAPDQRQICIDAFQKFTSMTKAERSQFLRNAERWQEMTAGERATWRSLVTLLPSETRPPLPPPTGANVTPPSNVQPPGTQSPTAPPTPAPGTSRPNQP